jgi:synaptojanin
VPAWTDRILRKGANLRQYLYDSAPLKFSDHRPVYAAFECKVNIVDEAKRDSISKDLYSRRKAEVGDSVHVADMDETEDEDLIGYDAIEPGLPPASSDRQKWWLDNKQPARAQVPIPNGRDGQPMVLNSHRPANPFGHSEEQDWISISRSSSRASLSSLSSSPFEKVMLPNMMNSTASSTTPRKPLPGHEAGNLPTRLGRVSLSGDHDSIAGSPPLPPPRRQTAGRGAETLSTPGHGPTRTATMPQGLQPPLRPIPSGTSLTSQDTSSTNPGSGRTLPPPVAKKPAHLVTATTASSLASSSKAKPSLPARSATMGGPGASGQPPPRLPSRHVNGSSGPQQGPVDLLDVLDDGGQEMGGWETLQPNTRT